MRAAGAADGTFPRRAWERGTASRNATEGCAPRARPDPRRGPAGPSATQTGASSSSSRASRFRATCKRRLMVPIGDAKALLISISDWPST